MSAYVYILANDNGQQKEYRVRQIANLIKYPFTEAGMKRLDAELFSAIRPVQSPTEARALAIHLVTTLRGREEAIFGHWIQPIMERSWPFQSVEQLHVG